jgi:hypothetical protein
MPHRAEQADGVDGARPQWFAAFLADRGTRKPSAHTLKAYCQDFDAIATLIAGGEDLSGMPLSAIMIETLRTAFAQYAENHEAASIQRCWSTWNVLCTFLYSAELIAANPMPMVGRPKLAKTLPKGTAGRCGGRPSGGPQCRPGAAATHRLDAARPRPDPDRAAGRVARR